MKKNGQQIRIHWTKEDRARHRAIREEFRNWHPTMEELLATGDYVGPFRHGAVLDFLVAMHTLKTERERQGLSLSDVARRSGLDAAAISRLENGKQANPTLETMLKYIDALGQRLVWKFEATEPPRSRPRRSLRRTKRRAVASRG